MQPKHRSKVVFLVAALAACGQPGPTTPDNDRPNLLIVDDARGGTAGFYWRTPTVPSNPVTAGTFDAAALGQLAIEICKLNSGGTACSGSLTARYTSSGNPRIQVDTVIKEYWVAWSTSKSLKESDFYRVRALRNGVQLGLIDVDVVGNTAGLGAVDRTRYVGVVKGSALQLRFQLVQPSVPPPPPPPPPPAPTLEAWSGSSTVSDADVANAFGGNMSGLAYEGSGSAAPGVMWASKNGPGMLYRLLWNGSVWSSDASNSWGAGKTLRYTNGSGSPDAEGVTFAGNSGLGIYVATERNNDVSGTSRNSILLFNASSAGATLTATREWNLTSNLPAVGANAGLEAITWVPDSYLVSKGFYDESKSAAYNPALYPNHGDGLFFVGLEANGSVYAYALNHGDGSYTRVATFASGFAGVMGLEFDRELNKVWVVCDDGCSGRSAVFEVETRVGALNPGRFVAMRLYSRPAGMANLNNEGFAIASQAECVGGVKPATWADDANTSGHALRRGTVSCSP